MPHTRRGISYPLYGSAIVILNPKLSIISRNDFSTKFITVIQIHLLNQDVTFISAYFKFSIPTQTHVDELIAILDRITTPVVIGLDSNAHSRIWFSRDTDNKGECIEQLLQIKNLHCANTRSDTYSFIGPRFSSNIDITLVSSNLIHNITNWSIDGSITSSDHSVISFGLSISPYSPSKPDLLDITIGERAGWFLIIR